MDLEHEIRNASENRVGAERGDDILGCSDVNVESRDQVVQCVAADDMATAPEAVERAPQSLFGKTLCIFPAVGDEKASRRHDPWRTARGQCLEIGVDDRMLEIGERCGRRRRRSRLSS